jgi:hypothetical protein
MAGGLRVRQDADRRGCWWWVTKAEQHARIDAHAEQLIAEELSLRDLRKVMGKTQAQLARKLNKPQASVSRMEKQSDMLISTPDEIVHAMGGRVRIVKELPGRPPLYLTGLTELAETKAATTKRSRAPASARHSTATMNWPSPHRWTPPRRNRPLPAGTPPPRRAQASNPCGKSPPSP